MTDESNREDQRDSLYLMASLRTAFGEYPVKVRNLSAGGAMLEGTVNVPIGEFVSVQIRNIGLVEGVIVWAMLPRMGIAFNLKIDPKAARVSL